VLCVLDFRRVPAGAAALLVMLDQKDYILCSPVLSLPRQSLVASPVHAAVSPVHASPTAWRSVPPVLGVQPLQLQNAFGTGTACGSIMGTNPPGSPMHLGSLRAVPWEMTAGTGVSPSPPTILATSPKHQSNASNNMFSPFASASAGPRPGMPPQPQMQQQVSPQKQAERSRVVTSDSTGSTTPRFFPRPAEVASPTRLPAPRLPIVQSPGSEVVDLYGDDSPVRIRNTFLDSPLERSPSLDRFFAERKVQSCPASGAHSRQSSGASTPLPSFNLAEDGMVSSTPGASAMISPRGDGEMFLHHSSAVPWIPSGASSCQGGAEALMAAASKMAYAAAEGLAADGISVASSTTAGDIWCSPSASEMGSAVVGQDAGSATMPHAVQPSAALHALGCHMQFPLLGESGEGRFSKKNRRRPTKDGGPHSFQPPRGAPPTVGAR